MVRTKVWTVSAAVLIACAMLNACSSGSSSDPVYIPRPMDVGDVNPLYPTGGADWNDYVKNDGADRFDATDTACDAAADGPGYDACIHGGEMRMAEVTGISSCAGITATDALDVFDWICDVSGSAVRVISTGLKQGARLSGLIDFTTQGWKQNSVTVCDDSGKCADSPLAAWWGNAVVTDNDGGSLNTSGTIYIVTADSAGEYTIDASSVALVVQPGFSVNGPGGDFVRLVSANSKNFLWFEGTMNALGNDIGISWNFVNFSVMNNIEANNANTINQRALLIFGSSNNKLVDVSASNNGENGLWFNECHNNFVTGLNVTGNGREGAIVFSSSGNTFMRVKAANNSGPGITLSSSPNNKLIDVSASNNSSYGVYLASSSNNSLIDLTVANNNHGVYLVGASDNIFSGFSVVNSGGLNTGIAVWAVSNSNNNIYTKIATANNGSNGIAFVSSSNNTLEDMAGDNPSYDYSLHSSSENYFTGLLKAGSNCYVSGGTNPGLVTWTCTETGLEGSSTYGAGNSSDAVFTPAISLASSFAGKVTTDDTTNTSDTSGSATYPADPTVFDWTGFEKMYRSWGNDGLAFPDVSNRGVWIAGDGRIWDWSLNTADVVVLGTSSIPTGNDTITHTWSDSSSTTYLRHAVEIINDDVGNDNGLCESSETCLYMPNIGSYQGHGNLVSAGSIGTGGTLENITLLRYETNGY